jgi:hypothetical protein
MLERRAGDRRRGPGASRDAAHEGRLAGAQLACQQDHVTGLEALAQALPRSLGFGR